MNTLVGAIPLRRVPPDAGALVGAKALNLAAMMRAGVPVPEGFCVTAEAYRAHVSTLRIGKPEREDLAGIRKLISSTEMDTQTAAGIRAAFKRLRSPLIAVRSSGTAEDLPGHSFAGLYDTYLRATDANGCIDLVKRCWASLWTERAFDYRTQNGLASATPVGQRDHDKTAMAVIVQQLVAADAAGAVFTADPVSGSRDRIIVEACWGLGEALVSGKVTPDRFVVDRSNLHLVERSISTKSVETAFSPTGSPVEQPVPCTRADKPCISDKDARKLARLALKVERVFGAPQDIEWAMAGPNLFILQSRPITTLGQPKLWEDRQVWSTTNAAEVLPGVLTPMVWSTVGDYVGKLLGGIIERIGISTGKNPLFDNVAGRIYMNLNTFTGMVRRMPFASRMSQAQMFGGQNLKPEDRAKLELGAGDLPDIKASPLKTLFKLPGFLLWILKHGPGLGRKWIIAARTAYEKKERPDLTHFSEAELTAKATATMEQMGVGGDGLGYALAGMMFTSVLYDLCRKWLKDETGANASRLLAGTGELQSAEAGIALWRLARDAAASPDVRDILLSPAAWAEDRPQLEGSTAGREFLARWDGFMHIHGHHARGEMDMYNPRWREQPDYVLDVVRNFIRAEGKTDPEADQRRHADEREHLRTELLARLRNPVKRWVFGYVVRQAQLSAAIRENVKDAGIRVIADTRAVLLELGQKLAARSVLAEADDIFFLRFPEVEPVVSGNAGFDVRSTVAERRAEYDRNLALVPPAIIVGRYDPSSHPPDTIDATAEELSGLAVSPGIVTGPARVILLAGTEQVLPGEILVAPFTDPGWTPYFIPAAGIVMDQGGLLSHGSIVAREYGIPAVVNVGPATKLIKTGQMIQVDGDAGKVRILQEMPKPQ
ncbi:MAG: PEP-utilizing enzyme [candidate division WOR-3 bacterium]|nr:PEP-utilizing enzyme [candidate division WOR-3 bacterium]